MKHVIRSMSPLFLFSLLIIIGAGLGVLANKTRQEKTEALMKFDKIVEQTRPPCYGVQSTQKIESDMRRRTCSDLQVRTATESNKVRRCAAERVLKEKIVLDECEADYSNKEYQRPQDLPATFRGVLESDVAEEIVAPPIKEEKKSTQEAPKQDEVIVQEETTIAPGTLSLPSDYHR